ncbi:phasin family protein [Cytobacillus purgationiresistens]|uniref:Polyhydroxyalkanoate synthesis regulator phasin n=1 Tax=Cytobacillus purgationiresistens TaxID=863449 RepID=A0ABU0AIK5_9BACI|nr:phasin family protein [Cytobacillus purgationiresistens]MDQ0270607.1 polyhydroxyalkanoate synthesis regulator phasin [Cytobacillus purgationiresistens]
MKNPIKKGMALGLGLAVASKEQAQKMMDDLVKKGEMSKQESKEFMQDVMKKGEEKQMEMDTMMHERMKKMMSELNLASKDEVQMLEQRVVELENQIKKPD